MPTPPEVIETTKLAGETLASTPSSQTMLWQFMSTIGVYSAVVIGLLLVFLWVIKRKPAISNRLKKMMGLPLPAPPPQPKLQIEEALPVSGDQHLMIVRCEGERFLVSSGTEGLRFMTKLDEDNASLMAQLAAQQAAQNAHNAVHNAGQGTSEDAAGIRGAALTPTATGVSEPTTPQITGFPSAFKHTVKDLLSQGRPPSNPNP